MCALQLTGSACVRASLCPEGGEDDRQLSFVGWRQKFSVVEPVQSDRVGGGLAAPLVGEGSIIDLLRTYALAPHTF